MKNITIIFGVLLLAVAGGNCQNNDFPEALKNVLDSCLTKLSISKDEHMAAMKNNDYTSNPKMRCLSECIMSDSGALKDGDIKVEKIKEIILGYNPTVTEADIDTIHAKCIAQAQQKTDKCDIANEYGECTKTVFMKA